MASGVTAKVLHVDLSARQTRVEEIPEVTIRKYLGGGALACHLLLRDMPAGVDPLGPDNMLVFMTSVINGLSLSGTNRYTAAAKSPLTGGYGESEAGGWWGPELRADRKSTRLNSSHSQISYAVFCLEKKTQPSFHA